MAMREGGTLGVNLSKLRLYLAGFLAGALSLLTFILILYLCLALFSLFFIMPDTLARSRATGTSFLTGPVLKLIGDSIFSSAWNALRGLWDVRLGFLIFGMLGTFAALAHQIGLMVHRKRAWLVSFTCMALIITISIITWAFAQREEIALWMAEAPETYRWRDLLLESYSVEVSVSLIFALTATYLIWAVWRWWYVRLLARLSPTTLTFEPEPVAPSRPVEREDWRAYASRLRELKREVLSPGSRPGRVEETATEAVELPKLTPVQEVLQSGRLIRPLAILFILCVVSLFPLNRYHDQVAMRFQHGIVFLDVASHQTHKEVMVRIKPKAYKIRVVNINGVGTVNIYLSPTADYTEAIESVEGWSFEWRSDEYLYADISIADLEPGDYYLHFLQESGWGYFEYMLSYGGGTPSHLSALAVGFLLACSLVLGLALIVVGAGRLLRSSAWC